MLQILAFLSRTKKYILQGVSKAFRDHITFKSLVSVRFVGHDVVTNSTLLSSIVLRSRKLTKMRIEEVIIDLAYVSALEKAFMINQNLPPQEGSEESKTMQATGGQAVLANKGVATRGEYFRSRVKELELSNI